MYSYLSKNDLETLFRSGRFQSKPTMLPGEISCTPGVGIEIGVCDASGKQLGVWTRADLQDKMLMAKAEQDSVLSNNNIRMVMAMIVEADWCESASREASAKIETEQAAPQKTNIVVPIKPPSPL